MTPRKKVELPFYFSTEGKFVHIVAEVADDPGTLASMLNILKTRVNFFSTSSYATERNRAIFSGFGKVLSDSDDANSLQRVVAASPGVHDCQTRESDRGLLVDKFHRGIQSPGGDAYILFPISALDSALEAIVQSFGSGGEAILFTEGRNYGRSRGVLYKRILGPRPGTRVADIAAVSTALGWGDITNTLQSDGKVIDSVVKDCFECSTNIKRRQGCSLIRGIAVGLAEGIFGREMTSVETKCRTRGDEMCEFETAAKDQRPLL